MRIAHVTDVYLPRLGGVELQVHDLATRQRSVGHEPIVVTTTAPPDLPEADRFATHFAHVPVVRLGAGSPGAGPYRGVTQRGLERVLDAFGVDAVHVHLSTFSPLSWSAARSSMRTGRPTAVSVHSMWHDVLPLVRGYARWHGARTWPVAWAAVSTAAAAAVREALDGAPVSVLANGIDADAWRQPPVAPVDDVPTLISVSRMVRRKRPRALLRTLLDLRAEYRFRTVLVGDGPLLPALRRDVVVAGAQTDVTLTGALDRAAIRGLLGRADLYLAPALRESFGIAALEARSAGLPVLARAGSGVGDFVAHGVEGWLAASETEFRTTIAGLLADPATLRAVRAHNGAVRPAVDWDSVLAAADALYDRAGRNRLAGAGR
ncbi:glycosyltransferase [Cryptosporangium phraense]|uniref:Glycosyltransferase family 4 protein n=1 Tax=Cryptosporangium phraense TaxID=2593070 RepID=A0A545AZX3_9ACTN|nr:glycosyltransferase [Cryptosporangium phraense]TQS46877.1 glycosyltransferase family 4 protein [Cryptosporangium phraense]